VTLLISKISLALSFFFLSLPLMANTPYCFSLDFKTPTPAREQISILEQQLINAHKSVKESDIALNTREKNQIFSWMLRQWQYEENKVKREGLEHFEAGEIITFKNKKLLVLALLGSGVEGIVYLVEHKKKLFALKAFDHKDDLKHNLQNMKNSMKSFNKIKIYDSYENLVLQEMQFGLSLKFLEHHPLYDVFKADNPHLIERIESSLDRKWRNNVWNSVLNLEGLLYLIDPH
jgi:hypothetical protein